MENLPINSNRSTLLRIGNDDPTSEYIELTPSKFKSIGQFNIFGLAIGQKEFRNLYKISNPEETQAMQTVFGVPRLGAKSPFVTYLEKKCKCPFYDIVMKALKTRISTMTNQISHEGSTDKGLRYKHQLEWLNSSVKDMESFTEDCPPEPTPLVWGAKPTGPKPVPWGAKPTGPKPAPWGAKPTGPKPSAQRPTGTHDANGCPCLTDINLLRDLVFIMNLIQGTASDEVKNKLKSISLNRLLDIAKRNTTDDIYGETKIVLTMLIDILKNNPGKSADSQLIQRIYKLLSNDDKPVTLDDLLDYIRGLNAKLQKCTGADKTIADMQTELDKTKNELAELKKSKTQMTLPGQDIKNLQSQLDILQDKFLDELINNFKKDDTDSKINALKDHINKKIEKSELESSTMIQAFLNLLLQLQKDTNKFDEFKQFIINNNEIYIIIVNIFNDYEAASTIGIEDVTKIEEMAAEIKKLKTPTKGIPIEIQTNLTGENIDKMESTIKNLQSQLDILQDKFLEELINNFKKDEEIITRLNVLKEKINEKIKNLEDESNMWREAFFKLLLKLKEGANNFDEFEQFIKDHNDLYTIIVNIFNDHESASTIVIEDVGKIEEMAAEIKLLQDEKEALQSTLDEQPEEIKKLHNQVNTLQPDLGKVRTELADTKIKLSAAEVEKASLEEKLANLNKLHDEAKEQLRNFKPDGNLSGFLNEDNDELKKLNERIELLDDEKKALQSTLDEQTEEIKRLRNQINTLQPDLGKVRTELADTKIKLSAAEVEKASLEEKLANLNKLHDEAKEQLRNFKPDGNLSGFLNEDNDELKKLNERIELLDDEKKALQSTLDEQTEEIKRLRNQVNTLQPDLGKVRTELADTKIKLSTSEANLKNKIEELENLKGLHEEAKEQLISGFKPDGNLSEFLNEEEIEELKAKIKLLEDKIRALQDAFNVKLNHAKTLLEFLNILMNNARDEFDKIEDDRDNLSAAYNELVDKYNSLLKDSKKNGEGRQIIQDELTTLRNTITELKEKIKSRDVELSDINIELIDCTNEKDNLNATINRLTLDITNRDKRISELENTVKRLEAQITLMTSENERELERLRAQLIGASSNTAEIDALRRRIQELQNKAGRVDTLEQNLQQLQGEIETEKEALKKCEEDCKIKTDQYEEEKKRILGELEEAKKSLREANELHNTKESSSKAELEKLQTFLDGAKTTIEALEAELAAHTSKGTKSSLEFEGAKNKYEARIADLQKQLNDLIESSKTDKESALKKQGDDCNERIQAIQLEMQTIQQQITQRNQRITTCDQERAQNTARINELTSELDSLKTQLATQKSYVEKLTTERDNALTSLAGEKTRANMAVKELNEYKKTSAATHEEHIKTIEELKKQIVNLESRNKKLESDLAETKKRFENIIARLALDSRTQDIIGRLLNGEEYVKIEDINPISKQSIDESEICNMYNYLHNTIALQLAYINGLDTIKKNNTLSENIFSIYNIENGSDDALLKDLALLFQFFFNDIKAKGIGGKGIKLTHTYNELDRIFGKKPIEYSSTATPIIRTGLRSDLSGPSKLSTILSNGSLDMFSKEITNGDMTFPDPPKGIPLSILAIRFIQLLYNKFNDKYESIKNMCKDKGEKIFPPNPITYLEAEREINAMKVIHERAKKGGVRHEERTEYSGYKRRLELYCNYPTTTKDNEYCRMWKELGDLPKSRL